MTTALLTAAQAAELRESLPTMQADIDAAQAKYDGAINRVSELQAELDKKLEMLKTLEALGYEEFVETTKQQIKQLRQEIVTAKARVDFCEMELREVKDRLKELGANLSGGGAAGRAVPRRCCGCSAPGQPAGRAPPDPGG